MFRSPTFTFIGILSFLLLAGAIALQILELDAYEMLNGILPK